MHVYSVWVLHDLFVFFVKTTCYHPDISLRYLWNHANHIMLITPCLLCFFLKWFSFVWSEAQRGMLGLSQPDVELVVGKHIMNKPCGKCCSQYGNTKSWRYLHFISDNWTAKSLCTAVTLICSPALRSSGHQFQTSPLSEIDPTFAEVTLLSILDHLNVRHTLSEALANSLKSVQP